MTGRREGGGEGDTKQRSSHRIRCSGKPATVAAGEEAGSNTTFQTMAAPAITSHTIPTHTITSQAAR